MNPAAAANLSARDRTLLLAITDPEAPDPAEPWDLSDPSDSSDPSDPSSQHRPDRLEAAAFLARTDIQPLFAALRALRDFRRELKREHGTDQAIDALVQVARTSGDPIERRLAATAALRALTGWQSRPRAVRAEASAPANPAQRETVPSPDEPTPPAVLPARSPPAPPPARPSPPHAAARETIQQPPRPAGPSIASPARPTPAASASHQPMPAAFAPLELPPRPARRIERKPTRAAALAGAAGLSPTGRLDTS